MSDSEIKIVLPGAAGRMGRTLIAEIAQKPDLRLIGATEPAGSSLLGADAGTLAGLPEPLGVARCRSLRKQMRLSTSPYQRRRLNMPLLPLRRGSFM